MGHTLDQWRAKVAAIIRDEAEIDVRFDQVDGALAAALAEHSRRAPAERVVEVAGNGTAYLDTPAGWINDYSTVMAIEYPARQDPPTMLATDRWDDRARSLTDVTARKIRLVGYTPTVSEFVRLWFLGAWPTPTSTAADDLLSDLDYEGVAFLVAAYACDNLRTSAARSRIPNLSNDTTSGGDRAARLETASTTLRERYKAILFSTPVIA